MNILLAEASDFSSQVLEQLRMQGTVLKKDLDRSELLFAIREADVLWIRLRHRIDAEVMDAAPRLKIIVSPTTGLNHIDIREASRRGIHVLSLQGDIGFLKDVRATAEHTIALTLALIRHLQPAAAHVLDGGWERELFKGHELYNKVAGVIGYGRLGKIVSRYLRVFGMRVLTTDTNIDLGQIDSEITLVPLEELLTQADIVTLHVNHCSETHGFFGYKQFLMMKENAWFINTSRGELIDESALLEVLQSGRLAGAALDVLSDEKSTGLKNHPLIAYARKHNNLLITPHIGGCTEESMEKTETFMATKLCAVLNNLQDNSFVRT